MKNNKRYTNEYSDEKHECDDYNRCQYHQSDYDSYKEFLKDLRMEQMEQM